MFVEADFWRPTGLGNRLFSWSRAKVFSRQTGSRMFAPSWAHLRGASITRGGIDYRKALRKILLFDNFKALSGEVRGLEKMRSRRKCKKVSVDTLSDAKSMSVKKEEDILVSFSGNTKHVFDDLWEHHPFILSTLKEAVKNKWLAEIERFQPPFIALNVRMGKDFKVAGDVSAFERDRTSYLRTPLDWYVQSLRAVRQVVGNMPVYVVSDGNKKDLDVLLNEPFVFFCSSNSAIGDLLILSKGKVLIGSGRSSFSAWASFLGKMPTVTVPGSSLQSFHVSKDINDHFVGELDVINPDPVFNKALIALVEKAE